MAIQHIYKNKIGARLPSVTTIIGRFKDSGGLLYWANSEGLAGKTLDEARVVAATAGTVAHDLVESHLQKRRPPEFTASAEVISKARAAFDTYLKWEAMTKIEIRHTEVPLVSDKYHFGGRLDAIGVVDGQLVLVDWKTSNSVYADYLYQLAAYKLLWEENYPDHPITGGFHLCRFAKEEGDFSHHYFPKLEQELKGFFLMLELYAVVKSVEKRVK